MRVGGALGVLVLAEVVCFDAYRIRELGRDAALVVDVGAGVGEFAVAVATRFPACRVVAFEPDAARCRLLSATIRLSR